MRGPLYEADYKHQLTGHETFPLRYGWLNKAFEAISHRAEDPDNKAIFLDDDAITRFGVGKNMVASIRHWATATGIFKDAGFTSNIEISELGHRIFGANGLDPFMEDSSTIWLLHWQLASKPSKTTWFWCFNHFNAQSFDRNDLVNGIEKLATAQQWKRIAQKTIKNDVSCFLRSYVAQQGAAATNHDDALESPFVELGLIKATGKRDGFRFVRGPKATLGTGVFVYALLDFWNTYSSASTISLEALCYEPGSPGRVFQFNENDLIDRLLEIEAWTDGVLRYSETAGMRQVAKDKADLEGTLLDWIASDYQGYGSREAA